MPIKLNVGLSKKIGMPDYGSLGASVNLELELDSHATSDPDRLRQQIRHLYGLAKTAIDEELASQRAGGTSNGHNPGPPSNGNGHGNGNGYSNGSNGHSRSNGQAPAGAGNHGGNGHGARSRPAGRAATTSQARAIRAIASRQGLDLVQLLDSRFGVQQPEDLSLADASALIDELKSQSPASGGGR